MKYTGLWSGLGFLILGVFLTSQSNGIGSILIVLALLILFADIAAASAVKKGKNYWPMFWASLVFPVISWIVVAFMNPTNEARESIALQNGSIHCPFCAEVIKSAAVVCKHCGRDLPKPN